MMGKSRLNGIYQQKPLPNPWEVDLSFRQVDFSSVGRNQGYRTNFALADWEKTYGYQLSSSASSDNEGSESDSDNQKNGDNKLQEELLRTTQLVYSYQDGKGMVPRLREPRNLYALAKELGPQQAARWPSDIQVLNEKVKHIRYVPPTREPFYKPTGLEKAPMVRGEENGGKVVYYYEPRSSFFIRSRVGGARSGPDKLAVDLEGPDDTTLLFESRFESGNLSKAVKVNETDYELWLRYDLYTNKHTQWFYFRVKNTRPNMTYRFTIVNFMKSDSLYNYGMRPVMYSEKNAQHKKIGWIRGGSDIKYYKNNLKYETTRGDKPFYSLTFTVQFPYAHDTVYFAHCYPYTYTDLQDYLLECSNDPIKSKICKQRVLCRTLAGNLVYVLTITSPSQNPEDIKHKKAVVITSRVHPGECNASWMMKGFLDYLVGNSADAKLLRDTFIFKIVPMLNPDGVVVGNYRCSLAGRDLNRNYKTVLKDSYPSVWHTKNMIRRLLQEREIIVYCDLHGHSRKQNVFIYGCENRHNPDRRLRERIFPAMLHKNAPDRFKYDSCKFKVQRSKEGTGRIVMWNMGIMNSYTMEATFCGSSMGKLKGYHFSVEDYEYMGFHFCDTLLDYCDPDNTKCANVLLDLEDKLRQEIIMKMQRDGQSVDDNLDIDLSDDYTSGVESSDGGSDSSVSDGPPVHLQFAATRPIKKKKKLKSKKERDRVRSLKEEPKKAPTPAERPLSDNLCDKKSSLSGHQAAHAKQLEKQPSQPVRYTTPNKRPKSHEDKVTANLPSTIQGQIEEKTLQRNDYLEALTNAYIRNGLLMNNDPAAPHFRYSGSNKGTNAGFNLDGLCPHHEQTFAAQYMAQQLQNMQCGEASLDDLVRSQLQHQASIPMGRSPLQRHILEVSAAQQRQQDILQQARKHGDRSAVKSGSRPRAQIPSATFVNYNSYASKGKIPPSTSESDLTIEGREEPIIPQEEVNDTRDEPMETAESKNDHEKEEELSQNDDDMKENNRKHGNHKGKHKEKGGRKSRMGMHDSDEESVKGTRGPDYLENPHTRKGPRVKSASGGEEMNSAIESIKELRQSLASNAMQQNLSPTTGRYIKRLMKETDEDIEELTNEIKHDIEMEKQFALERHKETDKGQKPLGKSNSTLNQDASVNTVSRASNMDSSSGTLKSNKKQSNRVPKDEIVELTTVTAGQDKIFSERPNDIRRQPSRQKNVFSNPNSDRSYDRQQRFKSPVLAVTNDNSNTSYNSNMHSNAHSIRKTSETAIDVGNYSGASNMGNYKEFTGRTKNSSKNSNEPLMTKYLDTSYIQGVPKSKSAQEVRDGSANSSSSREEGRSKMSVSDKYFEQTKRVRSAKISRQSVGKTPLQPSIAEAVPTKIQLMISQDHEEEHMFGGQFLPLTRTIRAPFYRHGPPTAKRKL